MVCSKCSKNVSSSKEIKIGSSIICEKCYDKVNAQCHTCYEPIYKGDLIFEVSLSWGAEYIISTNKTTNIIQCVWCYQHLRNGKKKEKWWRRWWRKWKKWILGGFIILCVIWLLIFGLPLFYPDLTENWNKTLPFVRFLLIALLFVIPTTILYLIISEFDSGKKKRK